MWLGNSSFAAHHFRQQGGHRIFIAYAQTHQIFGMDTSTERGGGGNAFLLLI